MLYRLRDQALTPRARGPREGRRRIAGSFAASLLLHTVILGALLVRLKWQPEPEPLPPPAAVSMIFEGGRPQGPSSPESTPLPGPAIAPSAPGGEQPGAKQQGGEQQGGEQQGEAAPAPARESPPPVLTPPLPEVTSQPPAQPPPETVQRQPATSPPEPSRPSEPPAPSKSIPPPSLPGQPAVPGPSEVTVPPPQSAPPPASPHIRTPQPAPPPAHPSPVQPQTWPPVRQAAPAKPSSDFPAPMDFSLGAPPARPDALAMGKPLLSLTLPHHGPADPTPYSLDTDADVGTDWRNALSEWVESHSYYPNQAVELGQQGTARVLVTTMPDGRVTSVELEHGSGSPWLDLALEGLFRGAKLPPLPKSAGDQPVPFHFTMHYILIR